MSIDNLMAIYRIVHATEAGVDPFENRAIQHLKNPLEEYLSRQPERHQDLSKQPRIVSDPAEASEEFELSLIPAYATGNNEEERPKLLKTKIFASEVPHYRMLAHQFKKLSSMGKLDEQKRTALLKLVEYEVRYLRGSDILWVGGAASGPC